MSIRAIGIQYFDEPWTVPIRYASLDESPPAKQITPAAVVGPAAAAQPAASLPVAAATIQIKLPQLPSARRLGPYFQRIDRRSLLIGSTAAALVISLAVGSVYLVKLNRPAGNSVIINPLDTLQKGTPNYATLLPAGKNISQLGGWTRVSPPDRNPVFAYTDKIDGAPISVSQQPLPDTFKEDTGKQLQQLAQSFKADQKLSAGGTTVYVGSSTGGPQSLILTKNGLLILIKSTVRIDTKKWADYVSSLQ